MLHDKIHNKIIADTSFLYKLFFAIQLIKFTVNVHVSLRNRSDKTDSGAKEQ